MRCSCVGSPVGGSPGGALGWIIRSAHDGMAPSSELRIEASTSEDSQKSIIRLGKVPHSEPRANRSSVAPIDISEGVSTGPSSLTKLMARAGRISIIRQLMTGPSGSQVRVNPFDGNESFGSARSTGTVSLEKHEQKLDATVSAVAVSPNDKLYAAASISGDVIICSVESGAIIDRFSIGADDASIGALVFHAQR